MTPQTKAALEAVNREDSYNDISVHLHDHIETIRTALKSSGEAEALVEAVKIGIVVIDAMNIDRKLKIFLDDRNKMEQALAAYRQNKPPSAENGGGDDG